MRTSPSQVRYDLATANEDRRDVGVTSCVCKHISTLFRQKASDKYKGIILTNRRWPEITAVYRVSDNGHRYSLRQIGLHDIHAELRNANVVMDARGDL
jgi:hypothetical protein